jgi:hypothetical protein
MRELPTVLLKHTTAQGTHYDWLLAHPDDGLPDGRLWTARVDHPSSDWPGLLVWNLTPIEPHRREYLTNQGPISGGRGTVTRVDEGVFVPQLWTDSRIVIDLRFAHAANRVGLTRLNDALWQARWLP